MGTAEIHVLGTPIHGIEQVNRLMTDLAAAHEAGLDLGSRAPHIRTGGDALRQLADELGPVIEALAPSLAQLGPQGNRAEQVLRDLLREVQSLAADARHFPADRGSTGLAQPVE